MATGVTRIDLLGVPVDVVTDENLKETIEALYDIKDNRQIVLLSFNDFMRSRRNKDRRRCLREAALVLPVSRRLTTATRFLKLPEPPLRSPYRFIIQLLGILEQKERSVYLLGSSMVNVRKSEATVRSSFPGLRIVGRYASKFPQDREKDVVMAIKKAAPTLLLAGKGLKGGPLWLHSRRGQFAPGLTIWEDRCFDVFAGKKGKPRTDGMSVFWQRFGAALLQPWRFLRVFRFFYFQLLLVFAKIRK